MSSLAALMDEVPHCPSILTPGTQYSHRAQRIAACPLSLSLPSATCHHSMFKDMPIDRFSEMRDGKHTRLCVLASFRIANICTAFGLRSWKPAGLLHSLISVSRSLPLLPFGKAAPTGVVDILLAGGVSSVSFGLSAISITPPPTRPPPLYGRPFLNAQPLATHPVELYMFAVFTSAADIPAGIHRWHVST